MKMTLEEMKTKIAFHRQEADRLAQERQRIETATLEARKALANATQKMEDARKSYTDAVIASPGSKGEQSAQSAYHNAKAGAEVASDSLQVLEDAWKKVSHHGHLSSEQDHRSQISHLTQRCWKVIEESEVSRVPIESLQQLMLAFAAAYGSMEGDIHFFQWAGHVLGPHAPSRDVIKGYRHQLAEKYGL